MNKMVKIDTCRICFTDSCYKNINNDYAYRGELENYGQMLRETFNLVLKSKRSLICEKCVIKLRDATEFREKILNADKYLFETNEKVEKKFDFDLKLDSDIEVKNEEIHIKVEPESETIIGNKDEGVTITIEKTPIKLNQDKNEAASDFENDDNDDFVPNPEEKVEKVTKNAAKIIKNNELKKIPKKKASDNPKLFSKQKLLNENTHKLVNNSNICIFKSLKTKYACHFCKKSFIDFKELRQHWPIHSNKEFICYKFRGLKYKNAEISNLKCRICDEIIENLDTLRSHLETHNIKFHDQEKHLLIPFRLEEGFECCICFESFDYFTSLAIHMNSHSTQNVCDECGKTFFNRRSLKNHIANRHSLQKCTRCEKTFPTKNEKKKHMKLIHKTRDRHYCVRCDMVFPHKYLVIEHSIEKHGLKDSKVTCEQCGKVLKSPINLKIHIRNIHLKERNFPCKECTLSFFTKHDLNNHERIHSDLRSFSCDFCETKFKSKIYKRRHLKKQHGVGL